MRLTGDGHVHTDLSWDTGVPSSNSPMEEVCRRAVQIGLPALVFTEHLDVTPWRIEPQDYLERLRPLMQDGALAPPPLDAAAYLERVDRCRQEFPELRILTGIELGQPHIDEQAARDLIDLDALDRVNGSLHTIPTTDEAGADRAEPITLYRLRPADDVLLAYLAELERMVSGDGAFSVVTHIDYALRSWPEEREGPFDPVRFEEPFRNAMRAIARSGRALELNTAAGLRPWIPQWWSEEGGRAVTLGSDAHVAERLAARFPEAMLMAERAGFRPSRSPEEPWTR